MGRQASADPAEHRPHGKSANWSRIAFPAFAQNFRSAAETRNGLRLILGGKAMPLRIFSRKNNNNFNSVGITP